ncbi:unnamed protein product, partial [Polarella glacialis]
LVLSIDNRRSRLRAARHNAMIYSSFGRVELVLADAASLQRLLRPGVVAGVFLSPPWAEEGLVAKDQGAFSVRQLAAGLDAAEILRSALAVAPSAAMFLPRVTPRQEV